MSAPAFTPGPWEVKPAEEDKPYIRVRGTRLGERYKIANVLSDHPVGNEASANAHLIAASTELYEALDSIATMLAGHAGQPTHLGDVFKIADAALAKARAEQVAK